MGTDQATGRKTRACFVRIVSIAAVSGTAPDESQRDRPVSVCKDAARVCSKAHKVNKADVLGLGLGWDKRMTMPGSVAQTNVYTSIQDRGSVLPYATETDGWAA